jgi:myosin heavy subunit
MNIIQIIIELLRRGDGASQAREEIDQLKESADKTNLSTGRLHTQIRGLSNVFFGLSLAMSGAASGIRGIATAIGGFFQVIVAHPIGRMIASLVTLGAMLYGVYQRFRQSSSAAKENAEESAKAAAAAQKLAKAQQAIAEPSLRTAAEAAKQLADEFDRAAQAAERTRKNTDELAGAELALKLATIDRRVASGEITEEQGKQERIESRLSHDQEKYSRERQDVQNQIASAEKNITAAGEDYERTKQERDKTSAEYLQKRVEAAEKFPELRTTSEDYSALVSVAKSREARNLVIELNALKQRLQGLESGVAATGGIYYGAKEKYAPGIETGQSRLAALGKLSQAAEVGASAQSIANANEITRKQVEEEKRKAAEQAAFEEKQHASQKEHEESLAREYKVEVASRADRAIDLQLAQEETAGIQFRAAQAASAKSRTPKQRRESAAALQSAHTAFSREQSETIQAKALQEKIRETVDPAALANLIRSIESLGNNVTAALNQAATAVNNVNAKVSQQSSQLKNGGLRTK